MPLMRRVATLGAAVAAARSYARQNPDKVNRYADQAAAFVDRKTQGKYRKQIDSALRQVRKETSVPGRGRSGASYRGPGHDGPSHPGHPGNAGDAATRSYPSYREDRPR
jgi:23S rRNA maturation mini-RNase III